MKKTNLVFAAVVAAAACIGLSSCGGAKALVIPRAVSTADAASLSALNLKRTDYDIINTVTETASVYCTYNGNTMIIRNPENEFSYTFVFNPKSGWTLDKFSGVATMGYFDADFSPSEIEVPNAEEFARRVAMARIINAVKDYHADAVVEPVTTTVTSQADRKTVVFTTTVSAKLIKLRTN